MASKAIGFDIFARDRASDKFDKVGRSADHAGGKLSKFGAGAAKAAKFGAAGIAVGAALAGKALFDMTKNAAADEAAQRRLAIALKNTTGATKDQVADVEDWISAQGRALGVTDDELRPSLQRFVAVTGDVAKAQKLASLAMDVSAGSGKSLEAVSAALARAQNGNMTGLARLGIATKNASGETLSLNKVMKNAATTYKGQAAGAANSLEGKMGRLKLIMDETKETIGAKLIPVVTVMATWFLSKGLPAVQRFGGWIQTNLFPIFARMGAVAKKVLGTLRGDVQGNLGGVREIISNFVIIARALWAKFGGFYVSYLKATFNNLRTILKGAFQVIGGIVKVFSAVLKGDWRKAWEGVKQIFTGAGNILKGAVKQLFNIFGTLAKAGGRVLVDTVKGIPGALRALGGMYLNAGGFLIGKLFSGLKSFGSLAGNVSRDLMNMIIGGINSGINYVNDKIPNKIGKGKFSFDLPDNPFPTIPGFAGGVTNFRGGLAYVHEGEVLANLPRGTDVIPKRRVQAGMGGGSGAPIVVQLKVGAKVLEQILIEHTRSTGRPLQVRTLGPA